MWKSSLGENMFELKLNPKDYLIGQREEKGYQFIDKKEKLVIVPQVDGNFLVYDEDEGYVNIFRNQIEGVVNKCLSKTKQIYAWRSTITLLVNRQNGEIFNLQEIEWNENQLSQFNSDDFLVFRLDQIKIKQVDLVRMKQFWQASSTQVSISTYQDFIQKGEVFLNQYKEDESYKFWVEDQYTLKIMNKTNNQQQYHFQSDNQIIFVARSFNQSIQYNHLHQLSKKLDLYKHQDTVNKNMFQGQVAEYQSQYQNSNLIQLLQPEASDTFQCLIDAIQEINLNLHQTNNSKQIVIKKTFIYKRMKNLQDLQQNSEFFRFRYQIMNSVKMIQFLVGFMFAIFFCFRRIVDKRRIKKQMRRNSNEPKIMNIKYQSVLGEGKNGSIVYQGNLKNKEVAIKRVQNTKLKEEINILAKIDNRNIIKYFCFEQTKDFTYIVLEKCICSIEQYMNSVNGIAKHNHLNFLVQNYKLKKTKKMIKEIVEALNYLHKEDIIHGNLNPQNILISQHLEMKIADFSDSKQLNDDTKFNQLDYDGWFAQEVLNKKQYQKASDIFSLGCIIYYLSSNGGHPFGNQNERNQNILDNKSDIYSFQNDILLKDLIDSCIQFDPCKRPSIQKILSHPYFWYNEDRLNFLCELSNYMEIYEKKNKDFDSLAKIQRIVQLPWNGLVSYQIVKESNKFNQTDFYSCKQLVRFIRNRKNHFFELSKQSKQILGNSLDNFYNYFESRFPHLLKFCYDYALKRNISLVFSKKIK